MGSCHLTKFPHQLKAGGVPCAVVWGDSSKSTWAKHKHYLDGRYEYRIVRGKVVEAKIILHPRLRLKENRREACEVLGHEYLHHANAVAKSQKVEYENCETNKVRRVRLTHDQIFMLEKIVGDLLWQNEMSAKCECRSCEGVRGAVVIQISAGSTAKARTRTAS